MRCTSPALFSGFLHFIGCVGLSTAYVALVGSHYPPIWLFICQHLSRLPAPSNFDLRYRCGWLLRRLFWTGLELARAHLLTGFLMASIAHAQVNSITLVQISDLVGGVRRGFSHHARGRVHRRGIVDCRLRIGDSVIQRSARRHACNAETATNSYRVLARRLSRWVPRLRMDIGVSIRTRACRQ